MTGAELTTSAARASMTVREFAYDPSAIFARVEKGETIDVTRHDELVGRGLVRPAPDGPRVGEWDKFTHIDVPDDVDPLAVLLEMRENER